MPTKRPLQKEDLAKVHVKAEESRPQPAPSNNSQSSKPTGKPAPPKREKSNLFSSFAKAKPKVKTETAAEPVSSQVSSILNSSYRFTDLLPGHGKRCRRRCVPLHPMKQHSLTSRSCIGRCLGRRSRGSVPRHRRQRCARESREQKGPGRKAQEDDGG